MAHGAAKRSHGNVWYVHSAWVVWLLCILTPCCAYGKRAMSDGKCQVSTRVKERGMVCVLLHIESDATGFGLRQREQRMARHACMGVCWRGFSACTCMNTFIVTKTV